MRFIALLTLQCWLCSTIPHRFQARQRGRKLHGLGVPWGYVTRDELETASAEKPVESAADLARAVLSMIRGRR
jgi:hypothetical protein